MANAGIKIGNNLNTDTDLDLKFTTKYSSLKLYRWEDVEFTTDGSGNGSVTVPHDLGYTPIVQVWGKHTASFSFLSATTYPNAYSLLGSHNSYRPYGNGISYYADADEVVIQAVAIGGFGGGVTPSTLYQFRLLLWVDLSEDFAGESTIDLPNDWGFKVSESGVNVFAGQEYQMHYSSKYRGVQYYPNHLLESSLTLPEMWASTVDDYVQEATYVDFNHSLGYPPLFAVFSDLGDSSIYEMPFTEIEPVGLTYEGLSEVSAWCDSSRVRVLFHRESELQSGTAGAIYPAKTINIYVVIFAESLEFAEN